MVKRRNQFDVSGEFYIQRTVGGVKLVSPDKWGADGPMQTPNKTIGEMMQLPFNVYFMDAASSVITMNQITVDTCGWGSVKNSLGKSVRDLWPDKYAKRVLANDNDVFQSRQLKIREEYAFHGDAEDVQALSFKFPWFSAENELLGIFGCALIMNLDHGYSLSTGLVTLTNAGLLSPVQSASPENDYPKKYFSSREIDVLKYLVRAKTAKEIGILLGLSYRTVEHYIENAKNKIGAASRSELIDRVSDLFK